MEKLTYAIQEALVTLLLFDDEGAKLVRALVQPKLLDTYYREIAESANDYYARFKKIPGEHALDLIETLKARNAEKAESFDELFRSMDSIKEGINREYVLSQASEFCKLQRQRDAIQEAVQEIESGKPNASTAVEAIFARTLKYRVDTFDPGISFNDPSQALSFLKTEDEEEYFPTGVELLDKFNIMPRRKALWMLMAASNKGKSWGLVSIGTRCLMARKRVLHVTLEMSGEEVSQRYVQAMFSVTKRDQIVKTARFEKDSLGRFVNFDADEMKKRPAFNDPKIFRFLTRRMDGLKHTPPCIIKKFPSGSINVRDFENYLDGLEASTGFIPDIVLLDYPDIMKQDSKHLRESIGQTYVELRGMSEERNYALAVVTQGNRSSYDAKVIREKHTSEDITKINTADMAVTFNQTDEEERHGLARLFVLKSRSEERHQTILISQAYAAGQFCLDCVSMNDGYWDTVRQASKGEGEDEE